MGIPIGAIGAIGREMQKSEIGMPILTLIGIAIELVAILFSVGLVFNYFETEHSRSITNLKSSIMGKILLYGAAVTTILVLATLIHSLFSFMPSLVEARTADEWYNEGINLDQSGKYDEAIKAFDEALKINPQYAKAWDGKGFALAIMERYDEANEAFDEALRIDPQYAEAWTNKGLALSQIGKHEEAIKAFDEALKINPQYAEAWTGTGLALSSLKRYDEAIKAYDKALKFDPQFAVAWHGKGLALKNLGRNDEANKAYDEALKLQKSPGFEMIFAIAGLIMITYLLKRNG